MRKYLLLFLLIVFLCGCGNESGKTETRRTLSSEEIQELKEKYPVLNKESEIETESVKGDEKNEESKQNQSQNEGTYGTLDHVFTTYPKVTYDEVKAGRYNSQYVIVECFVEKTDEVADLLFADVWYKSEKLGYVRRSEVLDWDELYCEKVSIQSGDTVQVCVYVDSESSFGFTDAKNIRLTKSKFNLDDVKNYFKQDCQIMDYKKVLRNPDDYKNTNFAFCGEVFQVVSESDSVIEMLVKSDDDEIVYVYYYREGTSRILEGDMVTIYGTFYILETYQTLLGTKTVPKLSVYFLELGEMGITSDGNEVSTEDMQTSTATLGERNALREAKDYLDYTAFSRAGLIAQLEYEGYSYEESVYGVDNCGADWKEQALRCAKDYLVYSAFSKEGLEGQLEYEGFTSEETAYGVENCGADWKEQAAKMAQEYLDFMAFSREELIAQLEYEGFTSEEITYGITAVGY